MSCLSFRIGCSTTTFSDEWFTRLLYYVARHPKVTGIYAVKEVSRKSGHHIHVLAETDMRKATFSQYMKNKFPELNKGNWSVKSEPQVGEDLEKAKCYLSKGEKPTSDWDIELSDGEERPIIKHLPNVLLNTLGVEVEIYYDKYWDTFTQNERMTVPVPTQVKTFVQRVAIEIELLQQSWNYESREDRLKVYYYLMKNLGEKGKAFDAIVVRRLMNGIWNILDHERFADVFIESLMMN